MDAQSNIQFFKILLLLKEKSLVMLGDRVNEKIIRNHLMRRWLLLRILKDLSIFHVDFSLSW